MKIIALPEHCYRIVVLTEMPTETDFRAVVEKDLASGTGLDDELSSIDWPSRSVILKTLDLATFKRNLVFACVMVEVE